MGSFKTSARWGWRFVVAWEMGWGYDSSLMRVEEFHQILRATGRYVTPAGMRKGRPQRAGFFATWSYAWCSVSRVLAAARAARCGEFDAMMWARIVFVAWRKAERKGGVITLEGFDHLTQVGGPVVYAANHMSMLETFILPAALIGHTPISIVLKESLLRYPVFGPPLTQTEPIAVSRKNAREDLALVLREGRAKLEAGRSVLLFPQGTRRPVFNGAEFNSLGEKLARQAGVPLVPVALQTDFQGIGRVIKDFGRVDPSRPIRFAIGEALGSEIPKGERHRRCVAFIEERLRDWGMPVVTDKGER